jgi:hypothetical protein
MIATAESSENTEPASRKPADTRWVELPEGTCDGTVDRMRIRPSL